LDATALERQKRRLIRLQSAGVKRSTVFVHDECRFALEALRPYLAEAANASLLFSIIAHLNKAASNTAMEAGPQYGIFRYPGGKSWLIPEIKNWIASLSKKPSIFVEPFAGGAIAGLTVAAEGLAPKVLLSEIDADISSVWKTVFGERNADIDWLCERLRTFAVSVDSVNEVLERRPANHRERAFRTIVRNRMSRGGLMTSGAGLLKNAKMGKASPRDGIRTH
jgi:DNA adenine methylase